MASVLFSRLIYCVIALSALGGAAGADYKALEEIKRGKEIRIWSSEDLNGHVQGALVSSSDSTVAIKPANRSDVLTIPLQDIHRLDVRRGRHPLLAAGSFLLGALVGHGARYYVQGIDGVPRVSFSFEMFFIGGTVGAVGGNTLAEAILPARWERVEVNGTEGEAELE